TPHPIVALSMHIPQTRSTLFPYTTLFRSGQPLDGRSDIYSLGITLFYLLVGRLPFIADSTIAVALLQVHENPPALGLLRGDITPYTDSVIQKALAKRPGDRFQTAGEFSVAFAQSIRIADQLYQINPNNNLSDGMKATSRSLSSGAKRALSTSKPVVRVKPEAIRSVDLLRVIVAIILFFAIAV